MFNILYSGIVEYVFKSLVDALAGHVTLNEWANIVKILKSRHRRPTFLPFCPTVCRAFAWASFLAGPGPVPRQRRFDLLTIYFRARQPGPFNSSTLAKALSLHWPGEARDLLEVLQGSGFLCRVKERSRVNYWLAGPPTPPGSFPGPPPGAGGRLVAGQCFEPLL